MKTSPLVRACRMAGFGLAIASLAVVARGAGTADERFVIQSVDITKEGRKLAPASPENPVYYYPIFDGYKERGGASRDYIRKPPDEETARQLINMLAKQGYLMASKKNRPTIVLIFEWGSITPIEVESGVQQPGRPPDPAYISNQAEIRAYVVGERARDLDRHSSYYNEMSSLVARHYLMISAFEFRRGDQEGEVLLWRAHITTELWGNYLNEVLPSLIAHAAPILGRNVPPSGAWTPKNAQVIVGTPVVVPDKK